MLSIEDAWSEIEAAREQCAGYHWPDELVDAARALALAGFRAGWKAGSGAPIDHAERDYGTIEDPGCMCRYHTKCREIKALS